jgi:transposase
MDKYRLCKSDSSFEARRFRAWELKQLGWKQKDIAAALDVTAGAVSQWLKRAREEGVESLRRRVAPGSAPRLSDAQRAQLPPLLSQGAEAYGFRGAVWTRGRVAEVIRQEFGVTYDVSHVGRILRACGWSLQKPARRAKQRDEAAIRAWKEDRWPEVEKKPQLRGALACSWTSRDFVLCLRWYAPGRPKGTPLSCASG